MNVATISLKLEDGQIRVIIEAKGSTCDQYLDLDNGFSGAARCVRKEVLGEIAGLDWDSYLIDLVEKAG